MYKYSIKVKGYSFRALSYLINFQRRQKSEKENWAWRIGFRPLISK